MPLWKRTSDTNAPEHMESGVMSSKMTGSRKKEYWVGVSNDGRGQEVREERLSHRTLHSLAVLEASKRHVGRRRHVVAARAVMSVAHTVSFVTNG